MNHNFQLLQTLYSSTFGKYLKFKHRFDKAVQSGKFKKLTKHKQSSIVSRLRKLYERLKSLQTQLKLVGAGAALSLAAALANPVSAQEGLGPFTRNDAANPLPPPFYTNNPRVAMVDIDGDGDLDSFIGNGNGDIQFFRNDSPDGTVRRFIAVTGTDNPFDEVNKGPHAAPTFADIDNDGDLDMLLGVIKPYYDPPGGPSRFHYSPTYFFRNTGTATNPVFTEQTGASNPFNGFYGAKYGPSIPIFVDMDNDGDVDLFMGGSYSSDLYGPNPAVQYYENQGTAAVPNFVATTHPLSTAVASLKDVALSFADFDNSGDLDAFVGQRYSGYGIRGFRNDGGTFTELSSSSNPARYISVPFGSPVFADIDGDEDLDLVVGHTYANRESVLYLENTGEFNLQLRKDLNLSPFGGVDVGNDAAPVFVDIDNDGDLDAIIGSKYSSISISVFTNEDGTFVTNPNHPLYDIISGGSVAPEFVDIDDDGDLDLFYGGRSIGFFRNIGTASEPEFDEVETTLFPTLNSSNSYDLSISFIDMDGDGDQDAFIGNDDYNGRGLLFFENTGSASDPQFEPADLPVPFDDEDMFESNPNVVTVDLDHDGDLDLLVTETYYYGNESDASRTRFFSNAGGFFSEVDNVLITYVSPKSLVNFADVDGDGDLDAFVGNGDDFGNSDDGRITYFENANPAPVTEVSLSTVSVSLNTPAILDPDLTISDDDDDDIVLATVTISNYADGNEVLGFTPGDGVTGEFEDGVLTIRGLSDRNSYETILRSVTYEFTGNVTSGARTSARGVPPQGKTVTFSVRDVDFTQTIVSQVNVITLNLIGEPAGGITVYNAVSPGVSTDLNDFMRITGLPADNKVSIFNRWGDKVFEVSGYDNVDKRFEGKNDNGKELPTGTYYYLIELKDRKINGYLSLRR